MQCEIVSNIFFQLKDNSEYKFDVGIDITCADNVSYMTVFTYLLFAESYTKFSVALYQISFRPRYSANLQKMVILSSF